MSSNPASPPLGSRDSPSIDGSISVDGSLSQASSRLPSRRTSTSRLVTKRPSREMRPSPRIFAADLASATVAALESDASRLPPNGAAGHHQPAVGALSRAYEAFFMQRLQIQTWLRNERRRKAAKRARKRAAAAVASSIPASSSEAAASDEAAVDSGDESEGATALNELETILDKAMGTLVPREAALPIRDGRNIPITPSALLFSPKQPSAGRARPALADVDEDVPHCDAVLNNSKTPAYADADPFADVDVDDGALPGPKPARTSSTLSASTAREKQAWKTFKHEIVRIAHTLRLKRWRHVPMELCDEITVDRLSGALTNAVYVVSPPPSFTIPPRRGSSEAGKADKARKIPKLLLRIYGPQVEHLIDRESELAVLKRLARHNIGPSLLGTFTNGRFEEFLQAKPLTSIELRDLEISRMIAKRMRELHDSIQLLPEEVDAGPMVWRNWEKWYDRCSTIVRAMDEAPLAIQPSDSISSRMKYICGAPWPFLRAAVEKYREWLLEAAGGQDEIRDRLVFAHNDAQYGNILRLVATEDSPLLLPANKHKRLVVIDFEYANANVRGLEFANHFTEWCYNYHDAEAAHACHISRYPRLEEQRNFIKAYLNYKPKRAGHAQPEKTAQALPDMNVLSIGPPAQQQRLEPYVDMNKPVQTDIAAALSERSDKQKKEETEREVERLLYETRIWRPANSIQWVAWGIVQAKPLKQKQENTSSRPSSSSADALGADGTGDEDEEEFDYVAYARDRALFFWADLVDLGVMSISDLPKDLADVIREVKIW